MNSVAVAKLIDKQKRIWYRLVTDSGIVDLNEYSLASRMRYRAVTVQNVKLARDSSSLLGEMKMQFSIGHDYPVIDANDNLTRNKNHFTLIGYTVNDNGKFFVLSTYDGNMFIVSNLEIAILEEYDLITNASYCKDGKVKLDNGKMEEVSESVLREALRANDIMIKNLIADAIREHKKNVFVKAQGNPDFARLDELEKQLPDHDKRMKSYNSLYNSGMGGRSKAVDWRDVGELTAVIGLGAASYILDSVAFAGQLRLGNAIIDSIFDKK